MEAALVPEAFKTQLAKFAAPLLAGLIVAGVPAAYAYGKSEGVDAGGVAALTRRVEKAEDDHDLLIEISANLKTMKEERTQMRADLERFRNDIMLFLQKKGDK